MNYHDFTIKIGAGNEGTYPVTVLFSRQEDMKNPELSRFPFNEAELQTHLVALQAALVPSGVIAPKEVSPEAKVQLFGQRLFEMLFAGEVGNLYRISLARAISQGEGLRVRLRIVPPELAALPWEFLYDNHHNRYLNLFPATPVVRYPEASHPGHEPLAVARPLQILGMVASPNDLYPALDVEEEKARFEKALESLRKTEQVNLTWVEGQTWEDLRDALWHGTHHIFHFIGHGNFDGFKGEGFLALAREDGTLHRLYAKQLAYLLMGVQSLRLVFLGACKGAQATKQDLVSSVAASLVDQGLPAVVAMQYDITDNAAIELDKTFYKALAKGWPVERCLAESRRAVEIACGGGFEWGIPVLYLRAKDGVLFDLQQAYPTAYPTPALSLTSSLDDRKAEIKSLYQALLDAESRSQWDTMIEIGEKILKLDGHHEATRTKTATAYNELSTSHYHQGDYDYTIECKTRAIELDSTSVEFYTERGVTYLKRGAERGGGLLKISDYKFAITDFNQALQLSPTAHHYRLRGIAYSWLGNYERAIADLTQAIELEPRSARSYYERSKIYYNQGKYHYALEDCATAIEFDSMNADSYYVRGKCYHEQGDYDDAIDAFTDAWLLDPDCEDFSAACADSYYMRGKSYHAQGNYDYAIKDYSYAIELDPTCADFYRERGASYDHQGDYERAIADYSHAIELDSDRADSYYWRGVSYRNAKDYERAVADYSHAIELDPSRADFYHSRGEIYHNVKDYERAIADYSRAIELDSSRADFYHSRGVIYNNKQDYERASLDYNRAIELDPSRADFYLSRGLSYQNKGNHDQAIADFSRAIELDPSRADLYYFRGVSYGWKRDYEQAIADESRAIELDPIRANFYYCRGLGYEGKGDQQAAKADFERAVELGHTEAQKKLTPWWKKMF